jgi:gliding motility associated protien GldN
MYTIIRKYKILALLITLAFSVEGIEAQNKSSNTDNYSGTLTGLSLRKNKQPQPQKVRAEDIIWKRDVYRTLDLTVDQNAPLYYPVEPSADRMNLFSAIFAAIAKGNVTAYEYLDGREVFNSQYAIKFKDLLIKFEIPYKEKTDSRRPGIPVFDIEAVDIPSAEVTSFIIKEVMYLDQRNSSVNTKITALCPVMVKTDEMGEARQYPMFWIPFESLTTFFSEQPIASDSLNSAERLSIYDFFNQRKYKGEIYKVSNLKNRIIKDYCKTPEEVKAEQIRLENELKNVDSKLWEPNQKDIKDAEIKANKEKQLSQKKASDIKQPKK